jgi:hypothetical protein
MATTNAALTRTWSLAVASAVTRVLISLAPSGALVEIAVTGADGTAPTVSGHLLDVEKGVTRDLLGDGAIWARVAPMSSLATAVLVVT